MLADLLAHHGVEEHCVLRGRIGFMAYHGGSLEEGTDVIAGAAAERCGASYYGVHQPADLRWHVPSTRIDPDDSSALRRFLDHVEMVITLHGFGRERMFTSLLLGGRNRVFADHVGHHVRAALPEYEVVTDLERIPSELRGQHERNPVNLPRHAGVQIELPPRVRGAGPMWRDWAGPGPVPPAQQLIDALAAAVSRWPSAVVAGPATT